MREFYPDFPFDRVVLLADRRPEVDLDDAVHLRRHLEMSEAETVEELIAAIQSLGLEVEHYEHPKFLAEHASRHRNDLVLSIFGGEVSRSRMALVPAMCESLGIAFVGPDAYGRIICQNKEVSKLLARDAGLVVPGHRLVRHQQDLRYLDDFPLPYVAKPLLEGSSIGISARNLVRDRADGRKLVAELLSELNQPILVEEFIGGREVHWNFVESRRKPLRAFVEVGWPGNEHYFEDHLYDAAHKDVSDTQIVLPIDHLLSVADAAALERLLSFAGPLGYGRIDGKLYNGAFVFLEITPDAWLGASGGFATGFIQNGYTFPELIAQVLRSAVESPLHQSASG